MEAKSQSGGNQKKRGLFFYFLSGSRALIDGPHVRENPADSFEG